MFSFNSPKIKKIILFFQFCVLTILGWSQYEIERLVTPTELVKEILGSGVESIENVRINGEKDDGTIHFGTGIFKEPSGKLNGIKNGVVISTLPVNYTAFPPDSSKYVRQHLEGSKSNHSYFDEDLERIISSAKMKSKYMYDGTVLEFDFVPKGSIMEFSYCFASDEYDKFVCSKFNDAFGFFLSGPGIKGEFSNNAVNLALIPGTNTPVTINTVNRGKPGIYKPDVQKYCDEGRGLKNSSYYVSNNVKPFAVENVIFNGFTTKLSANYNVICGEKYHIKIAITDVGDHLWNSGVFIESGSFRTDEDVSVNTEVSLEKPGCFPYVLNAKNRTNASNHYWDFGDGKISSEKNPTHIYDRPGIYKVQYKASNKYGCSNVDSAEFMVEVKEAKKVGAEIGYLPQEKCSSKDTMMVNFRITGAKPDSVIWDLGDGNVSVNKNIFKHIYSDPGEYKVSMRSFDFACKTDSVINFKFEFKKQQINKALAQAADSIIGCNNLIAKFKNNAKKLKGSSFYWDFGDGTYSNLYEPEHKYGKTGNYEVLLIVSNESECIPSDTTSFRVSVKRLEPFKVELDLRKPEPCSIRSRNLEVMARFKGAAIDSIVWDFDDGDILVQSYNEVHNNTMKHNYSLPGTYSLKFNAFDSQCNKDTVIEVEIVHEPLPDFNDISAPNIITPNGDGVNDYFRLFFLSDKNRNPIEDLQFYELNVFDRWGRQKYNRRSSQGEVDFWEFGKDFDDGVYFYSIKYLPKCTENNDTNFQTLNGHLTINH